MTKKFIFGILFLLHLNSKSAEAIIQATGLIGLFGDAYFGLVVLNPQPAGVAYAVLAALFYIATDGGISDRIGQGENLQE